MTKADIVAIIADATGLTKVETETVIDGFLSSVSAALVQGHRIDFRGFGSFSVKFRRAKVARNPGTGATVPLPERYVPVFKPSKILREAVDKNLNKTN
ncbi:MAG TPA: integration host factor subunit beta [Candidatus Marinimicrobia bacterium]|nr:integration host factor subunit beta [Candidatus Neomarinimicrobiota bacterium]